MLIQKLRNVSQSATPMQPSQLSLFLTPNKVTRHSAVSFLVASIIFLPWFLLYVTSGQYVLSPSVYNTLDVTNLCVTCFGLQTSVS